MFLWLSHHPQGDGDCNISKEASFNKALDVDAEFPMGKWGFTTEECGHFARKTMGI